MQRLTLGEWIYELRSFPGQVSRNLGRELHTAAKPVVASAKRNASWSNRIPGALTSRLTRSRATPGVRIIARKAAAPHARLYEFGHNKLTFRHPVFGNRLVWVEEATRPFIGPAIREHRQDFIEAADRAVIAAATARGYSRF